MSKYDRIDRIPFFAFILLASFQTGMLSLRDSCGNRNRRIIFTRSQTSSVLGIDCYRCLPKNKPVTVNQTFKSCSLFDYSSEFKIDCPLSTFCMKRNYTLDFPDGRKITQSRPVFYLFINFYYFSNRKSRCDGKRLCPSELFLSDLQERKMGSCQRCRRKSLRERLCFSILGSGSPYTVLLLFVKIV